MIYPGGMGRYPPPGLSGALEGEVKMEGWIWLCAWLVACAIVFVDFY